MRLLCLRATVAFAGFLSIASCAAQNGGGGGGGNNADGGALGGDGGIAGGDGGARVVCPDFSPRPKPRAESVAIYDTRRGTFVFFAGDDGAPVSCNPAPHPIADLWLYTPECNSFEKIEAAGAPGARARAVAIHDREGDRMIVFGGRFRAGTSGAYTVYNETWAYSLANKSWTKLETMGTPPRARSSAAAGYNAATDELVIYGGNASTNGAAFTPLSDTVALHLRTLTWRQVSAGGGPGARLFHSVAIDGQNGRLYTFGGGDANAFTGPFFGDLWEQDLSTGAWTLKSRGGASTPKSRIQSTLTLDAAKARLILFGGHDDGQVGNNNDTWAFDLAGEMWSNITPVERVNHPATGFCSFPADFTTPNLMAPDRRAQHFAALDATGGRWFIGGGRTDCGIIDDLWSFDLAAGTWTNRFRARFGEACARGQSPDTCTSLCQ